MEDKLIPIFFEHVPYCQKYLQEYHPDITGFIYLGIIEHITVNFYDIVKNNVPEADYTDILNTALILSKEAIEYKKKLMEEMDYQDKKEIFLTRRKCNEIDTLIRVLLVMFEDAYIYMNR